MAPPTMNCAANVPKELQTSTDKRLEATVQLFEAANRVHNVINELQLCVNALKDKRSSAKNAKIPSTASERQLFLCFPMFIHPEQC